MIQYILECIAFQLLFLIIYDLFLKKETFFQWNRAYLIGTYVLSILLPWVKIEAFKTNISQEFIAYPEFLWSVNNMENITLTAEKSDAFSLPWYVLLFLSGVVVATLLLGYKLFKIEQLRRKGDVHYFQSFTRVVIQKSRVAFSFFKTIFMGEEIREKEYKSIIAHELVHIQQNHSLDLLFFELMRIVGWFNPLVYVYQHRISELHEFIADAQVSKANRKEQYQLLLSQVFQTENISFVNQFFKSSLIKKRIVMLQKQKSKKIYQLKYLALVPLVVGMLFYTSLEAQSGDVMEAQTIDDVVLIEKIKIEIEKELKERGTMEELYKNSSWIAKDANPQFIYTKEEFFKSGLIQHRYMQQFFEKLKKEGSNSLIFNSKQSVPQGIMPSTSLYESYVTSKRAFRFLDENLKISIKGSKTEIDLVEDKSKLPSEHEIFKVKNSKDLTGNEVKSFNAKLDEVFENHKEAQHLVLMDKTYTYHIYQKAYVRVSDFEAKKKGGSKKIDMPFAVVDEVPVFPSCENAKDKRACFNEKMHEHIRKNFNYPKEAQEQGLQGRVNVVFTILENGNIGNIRYRGPHELLELEALRIINELPKMAAGKQDGKAVNVLFSIPITFRLQGNKAEKDAANKNWDNELVVPFAVIDEVPVFPSCENASDKRACFNEMMNEHIRKNFNYPIEAQKQGIQGRVNIMFTILEDGNIGNIRYRGPHELLEKEALRIINKLPKIKPGVHNGNAVNVPYSMPITFKLSSNSVKEDEGKRTVNGKMKVMSELVNEEKNLFLKGKVTDEESMGIPGVNIVIDGKEIGTVSNFDGNFQIKVEKNDMVLFIYKGLKTVSVSIAEMK